MELFAVFLKEEVNGMKHKWETSFGGIPEYSNCKEGDDKVHG